MTELREAIEAFGERVGPKYDGTTCSSTRCSGYRNGFTAALDLLWPCMEALKCNKTFHSLGGIDDCEPCLVLKSLKEKVGG